MRHEAAKTEIFAMGIGRRTPSRSGGGCDLWSKRKDEIEGALAVQMACTHTAAMGVLAKLDVAFATERRVAAFGSAAARLMRTFATPVEVLRRLRNGGHQYVRVEHVQISDGGQAIIGNVKKPDVRG